MPSPRAAHATVHVGGSDRVYSFGGRHDQFRLSDLHMLQLDTLTWHRLEQTGRTYIHTHVLKLKLRQ